MPVIDKAKEQWPPGYTWLDASRVPERRNGWVVLLLSLLTIGCYAIFWIYRLQQEHARREGVDMPAPTWLTVFVALTVLTFVLIFASGYANRWDTWGTASRVDSVVFGAALSVAVAFNVWFGAGSMALTNRFHLLRGRSPQALVPRGHRLLLALGVVGEAIAVAGPPLLDLQIVSVPAALESVPDILGRLGTGSLLAWAIVLHRDANTLAEARVDAEVSAREGDAS